MQYRRATLSDLESVLELTLALAADQRDAGSRIDPSASEAAFRERLARSIVDGGVTVAETDGEVVGVVTYRRLADGLLRDDQVGLVEYLYVEPAHRGAGVGARLLDRAEAVLADRGVDVVELEVLAANTEAVSFYREHGYGDHRHRLAKRLSHAVESDESE